MTVDVRTMKILAVDDEPLNLALLEDLLGEAGYNQFRGITDSRKVAESFLEFQPDVILLDLMMPFMDGFAVIQKLRLLIPIDDFIPILVLTADDTLETKRRTLSAGATDFLTKPLDPIEVILRIRNILERRSLHLTLRGYNAMLEKVVQQRTQQLQDALVELKAAQKQAVQQERLAALGTMASGITHDFNNMLTPIIGFTDLLIAGIDSTDRESVLEYLNIIFTAANDGVRIVDRLREFYRPTMAGDVRRSVDLNELIKQSILLTEPKWKTQPMALGKTIEVRTAFNGSPVILGDAAELREVFTNLIFNAVDAMPEGGVLSIRSFSNKDKGGEPVRVEIADTGTGMTEEVRQRCMEPFFTTKGDDGTGLGLAMVYGIIHRYNGILEIESESEHGTTFILSLPPHNKASLVDETPATSPLGHPLHILVVDDQPILCQLLFDYLTSDSHSVETATSAREAVEKFRSDHFDLVMTDKVMPEMTGDQLAVTLTGIRPNQAIVMMTGGEIDPGASEFPGCIDAFLKKPITRASLRRSIADAFPGK